MEYLKRRGIEKAEKWKEECEMRRMEMTMRKTDSIRSQYARDEENLFMQDDTQRGLISRGVILEESDENADPRVRKSKTARPNQISISPSNVTSEPLSPGGSKTPGKKKQTLSVMGIMTEMKESGLRKPDSANAAARAFTS